MTNHDTVYQNCPHFAVADDPTTGLLFPSQMGRCFRVEPATAVPLDHQQTFCLSAQHPTCPIYCQSRPVPTAPPLPQPTAKRGRRLITAVFLLSLLVFSLWQWARRPTATPLPTVAAVAAVANTPPRPPPPNLPSPHRLPQRKQPQSSPHQHPPAPPCPQPHPTPRLHQRPFPPPPPCLASSSTSNGSTFAAAPAQIIQFCSWPRQGRNLRPLAACRRGIGGKCAVSMGNWPGSLPGRWRL